MNFHASNEFNCPYCGTILDTAAAFGPDDKPKDGHFTICNECANPCMYSIKEGIVSLRVPTNEEIDFAKQTGFWNQIEEMIDFVKSKPGRK